jgi:spermidine/putrescine transport system substrate-binding protein
MAEKRDADSESGVSRAHGSRFRSLGRRRFLAAAGATATAGLAGCTGGSAGSSGQEYAGEQLRVTGFAGTYADTLESVIGPMFTEETGAELVVSRVNATHIPKIKAAPEDNPPFDAAAVTGLTYKQGRGSDFWLELREENIPNRDQIYDYLLDYRPTDDALPVDGGLWTIVYREEMDWTPSAWVDFTDDRAEQVSLRSDYWNFPVHVAAIADQEAPLADELYDESLHDSVFETIRSMNIPAWTSTPSNMWQLFENGVVDMAMSSSEQSLQDERVTDGELAVTVPAENSGYLDMFVVVRGTEKRELAEKYIDFMLSTEVQERWAEETPNFYANENIEYPGDLGERVPTSSSEFEQIAFPDWNTPLFEYRNELSTRFKEALSQS